MAEVNFTLALSFSRNSRHSRNGEDVIIIHKKKEASKDEKMMVLFTVIKCGWNDSSVTFKMHSIGGNNLLSANLNSLSFDHSGSQTCVLYIEHIYPNYIRELFRGP